jgi:RNA polymerase sigma factor (TIGR02999 family)
MDAELWKQVEQELRERAGAMMRRERVDHTLQATALIHESYIRLAANRNLDTSDRAAFMAAAAVTMRRVLVDHARKNGGLKRGGGMKRLTLSGVELSGRSDEVVDVLDTDRAIDALRTLDEREAQIVEMKFFGGMTHDEIALQLGISPRLVEAEWAHAKIQLARLLSDYRTERSSPEPE